MNYHDARLRSAEYGSAPDFNKPATFAIQLSVLTRVASEFFHRTISKSGSALIRSSAASLMLLSIYTFFPFELSQTRVL
jgi:hypothetical protein